jgi:hemerythrin superfamily protein
MPGVRPERELPQVAAQRHHELEAACHVLLGQLAVDPHVLAASWDELDAALRDHLAAEEELILPAYQLTAPEEGDTLRTEHARIRELLHEVGRGMQHHRISAERLRELVALLHTHATREETVLYPWAERSLPPAARRALLLRIGDRLRPRSDQRPSPG